jgi:hypothetical protein
MEEVLSFFWIIWFTIQELGGSIVALGSMSMIRLPLSSSDSTSEPAFDSEAFTSVTSICFKQQSLVLCQGLLWKSHHFPVSFFVFLMSLFACGLD